MAVPRHKLVPRITKVAVVDRPAQEGGKITAIAKRNDDKPPTPGPLAGAVVTPTQKRDGAGDMSGKCPTCKGDGKMDGGAVCKDCGGSGYQKREEPTMADQDLKKRNSYLEAVLALPSTHRAHHDALPQGAREEWVAKSHAARDADVTAAEAANAEVYKSRSGRVFRKSDDPDKVDMAKRLDAQDELIAKQAEAAEVATFEKRAHDDLGNLTGTDAERGAMLRAIEKGIAVPEAMRPKVMEILKAADATYARTTQRVGRGGTPEGVQPAGGATAVDAYQKGLQEFAKAHKLADMDVAEARFAKTDDGKKLYAAAERERPSAGN
jgi:hypothetical protein